MAAKEEFNLSIMNEKGVLYYGPCTILFLPSIRGEIAVMKHHTPMILKLTTGSIKFHIGSDRRDIPTVVSGIAYIAEDEVSVLIDF